MNYRDLPRDDISKKRPLGRFIDTSQTDVNKSRLINESLNGCYMYAASGMQRKLAITVKKMLVVRMRREIHSKS